jgi:hypothetical protein
MCWYIKHACIMRTRPRRRCLPKNSVVACNLDSQTTALIAEHPAVHAPVCPSPAYVNTRYDTCPSYHPVYMDPRSQYYNAIHYQTYPDHHVPYAPLGYPPVYGHIRNHCHPPPCNYIQRGCYPHQPVLYETLNSCPVPFDRVWIQQW